MGEQQLFHAGYTLERVHVDIMGPLLPTPSGNRYMLVIVDQFTKWVEAYPMIDHVNADQLLQLFASLPFWIRFVFPTFGAQDMTNYFLRFHSSVIFITSDGLIVGLRLTSGITVLNYYQDYIF